MALIMAVTQPCGNFSLVPHVTTQLLKSETVIVGARASLA